MEVVNITLSSTGVFTAAQAFGGCMTLTTEWLKERLKNPRTGTEFELIKEVLASRESQPVAWRHDNGPFAGAAITRAKSVADSWIAKGWTVTPLFTAPAVPGDYFGVLVQKARVSADKAMRKFPQPNYVLNKVAEESGEVIKAVIHYTEGREEWVNVEGEIIDNLAMLIRLVVEGDQVIGFTPPDACRAAMLAEVQQESTGAVQITS
ncbi:hypothetical protein [Serratia plymuthica]|uniref:hypothetical protein n=1 Tax=Serratia plymuthica TaxID=82996 RepID=UPI00201D7954|nr:hypothetical protein [Serratia plymuthica]